MNLLNPPRALESTTILIYIIIRLSSYELSWSLDCTLSLSQWAPLSLYELTNLTFQDEVLLTIRFLSMALSQRQPLSRSLFLRA